MPPELLVAIIPSFRWLMLACLYYTLVLYPAIKLGAFKR